MKELITHSLKKITVPFYDAQLLIIDIYGMPYIPMRPVVEDIGLDWKSQYTKLKQRFSTCVVEITMQLFGDIQSRTYICLPLCKLFGWLMTISPNKVKPEIKPIVERYQNECDDVLSNFWFDKIEKKTRAIDEWNQLELEDKFSRAKATPHSLGMHQRK